MEETKILNPSPLNIRGLNLQYATNNFQYSKYFCSRVLFLFRLFAWEMEGTFQYLPLGE